MKNAIVDDLGYPVDSSTGVRCGNHGTLRTYHPNADTVKFCYVITDEMRAQQEAELAAEARAERWFEERGADEAYAQDRWEQERGVIQFADAYRMACPELFEGEGQDGDF